MFDWWWEFLYNISYWINQLLDIVYKLFLFFSGSAPAEVNMELTGRADGNVLADVFSLNTIPFWFLGFVLIAGTLFLVCIIIAMLRTEWAKDNKEAKIKVIISTAKGIMILLFIPAIFGISIMATTTIMSGLIEALGGTAESDYSFAQQLFSCCLPDDVGNPNWNTDYNRLNAMLDGSGKSMQDYNYLVAYVGGLIMLFTVGISVITVIGRIIELVLLYVISPVVVSVSPLDEGNRLGIWKDLVISKFLSVAGMIICYYIFFLVMNFVNEEMFTGNNFTIKIAKLLFAIAGCLTANKGGLLITNLVGHNSALIEGQQQGIVGQTVSSGMFAGLKVVGTLATSSVHMLRNGASKGANMLSALSTRNASNNANGTTPFANMDGGTGIREASNVATMVSNAQNGSTFTEKANTYTDGKNQAEGGNNKPLGDFNKGTEPTNNAGETMREGKGFGGITPPPNSKPTVDVTMPDSPTVMEMPAPSVMPTADAGIKSIIEEGKNLNKGDSDKK